MKYSLFLSDEVRELVRHSPPHLKSSIRRAFDEILITPSVGKPLNEELEGLHSYRLGRFRIVYRIKDSIIVIAAIGPRKTIYQKISLEFKRQSEETSK